MRIPILVPFLLFLFVGLDVQAADWRGGKVVSVVWNSDPEFVDEWNDPLTRLEITLEDSQFDKATYYHFVRQGNEETADRYFETAKQALSHGLHLWINVLPGSGFAGVALTPPNTTALQGAGNPERRGNDQGKSAAFRSATAAAGRDALGRALPRPLPSASLR